MLANPVKVPPCGRCFARMLLQWGVANPQAFPTLKRLPARVAGAETPDAKWCCRSWSVEDVVSYLGRLGLSHVEAQFRENAVDGEMLADLSQCDLQSELGLTVLQTHKVVARLPR